MSKILGFTFEDKITGFVGVATGHVEYITGCNQTLLAPRSKDGGHAESHWFDDQRLIVVENVDQVILDNGDAPGFDKPAPIR